MARATSDLSIRPANEVPVLPASRPVSPAKAATRVGTARDAMIEAPRSQRVSPLLAMLIGFIAGSVFWHALGFWHFVGRAVFAESPPAVQISARTDRPIALAAIENCTTLTRDPVSGTTTTSPCPPGSVESWSGPALRRSDRLQALPPIAPPAADGKPIPTVAGWSAVTSEP